MNPTRVLMSSGALFFGAFGLLGTFAPEELLNAVGAPASGAAPLLVQVLGALYLGFASLNWMARDNLIGGIYSRPVVIGNLTHFLVAGLALIKIVAQEPVSWVLWPVAVLYAIFAAGFGVVLFRHPIAAQNTSPSPAPRA